MKLGNSGKCPDDVPDDICHPPAKSHPKSHSCVICTSSAHHLQVICMSSAHRPHEISTGNIFPLKEQTQNSELTIIVHYLLHKNYFNIFKNVPALFSLKEFVFLRYCMHLTMPAKTTTATFAISQFVRRNDNWNSASVYGNVVTVAPSVPFMQQAPLNQNSGNFCTHTDVQCSVQGAQEVNLFVFAFSGSLSSENSHLFGSEGC